MSWDIERVQWASSYYNQNILLSFLLATQYILPVAPITPRPEEGIEGT